MWTAASQADGTATRRCSRGSCYAQHTHFPLDRHHGTTDVAGAGTLRLSERWGDEMRHKKRVVHTENRERAKAARNKIVDTSDEMTKRRIEEHTEKGSSSWLSVLPLAERFSLLAQGLFVER